MVYNFSMQSYLISGRGDARGQTNLIAKAVDIDLDLVSPDVYIIKSEKNSISIDEIRDLKGHIFQKPVHKNHKFIVIEEAEKLTLAAQNALLKILEEPPRHAIIVLEAKDKSHLIPTILSRVVVRTAGQKLSSQDLPPTPLIFEAGSLEKSLEEVSNVQNARDWLDEQIENAYKLLIAKLNQQSASPAYRQAGYQLLTFIENCARARAACDANVNPKFVLANLVFTLRLRQV